MAKWYRYMCMPELQKVLAGETVTNEMQHAAFGQRSSSVGFCFLAEKTEATDEAGNRMEYAPLDCIKFLNGIVNAQILVEFESNGRKLRRTKGIYAKPLPDGDEGRAWDDVLHPERIEKICVTEFCIKKYNRQMMRPVRVYVPETPYGIRLGKGKWMNI